jgi:hypothetical protein
MIKAAFTGKDGKRTIILGLSDGNITKLKAGQPIPIDLTTFGLSGELLIMYGETEQAIVDELSEFVDLPPVSKSQA